MAAICKGKPSASWYGNGCRCADCREAWRLHSAALRESKRKKSQYKPNEIRAPKHRTKRDTPVVFADAFTREEILRARGM